MARRLPGRRRQPRDPHAEPGPTCRRRGPLHQRLFLHAHVHAGARRPAHGSGAVEPRHAALCRGRVAVSAGNAARPARRRLLHCCHRQAALPSAAQLARLSSGAAGRIGPHRIDGLPKRLPELVLVAGAEPGSRRDRTRLERFRREALCAAGAPASHRVDRPDGRGVDRQLPTARAIFPEGVLRAAAQSLRPAGAFVAALPGCRSAGRDGGALGQALCAAERSAERRVAWRSGRGTGAPFAPGILRLGDVRGRADRPHHRGADAARADGGDAHHLFLRPRRHDGRSPSVAQVVRRMRVRRVCP